MSHWEVLPFRTFRNAPCNSGLLGPLRFAGYFDVICCTVCIILWVMFPGEVQALLRDKADPNVKDCRSETPLLHAAAQGDLDVCSPDSGIDLIEEDHECYSMLFTLF